VLALSLAGFVGFCIVCIFGVDGTGVGDFFQRDLTPPFQELFLDLLITRRIFP